MLAIPINPNTNKTQLISSVVYAIEARIRVLRQRFQSGFKTYDSRNSILRYPPTHGVPIRPCWFKLTSRTIFKFRSNFGETSYVYGLRRNKHWIVDQIATCDLLILVLYIWQVIILIWLHILCSISIYFEQVRFFFFFLLILFNWQLCFFIFLSSNLVVYEFKEFVLN